MGSPADKRSLGDPEGIHYVRNHHHPFATWMASFRRAGLDVEDCVEIPTPEAAIETNPAAHVFPGTIRAAASGRPFVLCWRLRRRRR